MGRNKIVFVIDDDPGFRQSVALLLETLGFNTELYNSAEAFLSGPRFAPSQDGCIVLDIHLKGMSGIELAKRLTDGGHALPIIFVTGNDNDAVRKAALAQDCVAYLPKPFAAKALLQAIDHALA
jgi:FixJ family two-component response regulator